MKNIAKSFAKKENKHIHTHFFSSKPLFTTNIITALIFSQVEFGAMAMRIVHTQFQVSALSS